MKFNIFYRLLVVFSLIIAHPMARITVEDCLEKIDSQYDLVLLAKERTSQLNAGELPLVPKDDDKNTVIPGFDYSKSIFFFIYSGFLFRIYI